MSSEELKNSDEKYMRRALELARQGEGLTRPNPPVGAVLVLEDYIIAEGWHRQAGGDHAERDCLNRLPPMPVNLASATLYVTLEPCSTHGRTPPCTDIILEKGVGRVVVSVPDLNPKHAGRGLDLLRARGVDVQCGVCAAEGQALIAPFQKLITQGLPYLTLKLASTLDGKIADRAGDSQWITGPEAREVVQQMRRRADAIMVGSQTVLADDPSLLPRPAEGRTPYRVIIDSKGRVAASAKVCTDEAKERTMLMRGPLNDDGYCDLEAVLRTLAERGVMHVLCEGGGELAAALIDAGLVDEYAFFVAPKLLGPDARPNVGGTGRLMGEICTLEFTAVQQLGADVLMRAKNCP